MIMRAPARRRHRLFYGPRRAAAAKRNKKLAGAAAGTGGYACRRLKEEDVARLQGKGEGLAAAASACNLKPLTFTAGSVLRTTALQKA